MAIEQRIIDLINAEIDDAISAEDRAMLEEHLAHNPDARQLHDEISGLCAELNTVESVAPPAHLKHVILHALPPQRGTEASGRWAAPGTLFGGSMARYAMTFAAGVLLTYTFIASDRISRHAFDDVTGLVGTISGPDTLAGSTGIDSILVSLDEIAGSVHLKRAGSLLILDFDLASQGPIEIVTVFADRDIWFNGFAQLESNGTTIAAESGQVTVRMAGQRRYAVYLHKSGHRAATINLRFYSGETLIHEDALNFSAATED